MNVFATIYLVVAISETAWFLVPTSVQWWTITVFQHMLNCFLPSFSFFLCYDFPTTKIIHLCITKRKTVVVPQWIMVIPVCNHWISSLLRNPVTNKKHYRLYVINKMPQIRVLDFQKVKLKVSTWIRHAVHYGGVNLGDTSSWPDVGWESETV